MKHEVVCAVQECKAPCEGCTPIPSENDHCCPERYECREYTYSHSALFFCRPRNSILLSLSRLAFFPLSLTAAPKRPVPHRDIYSNETHVTTTITTTIAVNRIESETESSSAPPESASSPPPTPTTTGTQEPEQSSSTVESTSQLPISTTQVADALSTNEPSVTPNIPESGSTPEARSESEIREGDHSQTVSATPPAEQATASVTVSTEPTSTGREESEKSTTSAEAIHIGMKIGPQDTETGSTGSPKIGSEIPGDGEKVDSEVTAATPGFENDGTEGESFLTSAIILM